MAAANLPGTDLGSETAVPADAGRVGAAHLFRLGAGGQAVLLATVHVTGAVLQPDGSQQLHAALSEVLKATGERLLYDEEVPREGQHVTRLRVVARWIDGSTWLWTAFRKQVGRGEGSSGLAFDRLQDDGNG